MVKTDDKVQQLCELEGCDEHELIERAVLDSVAASICINPECDYTAEMEPDQDMGYCEECGTQTVQSILILRNMI